MNELFFVRKPIFDCKQKIWGYELVYLSDKEVNNNCTSNLDDSNIKLASSLMQSPDSDFGSAYYMIDVGSRFIQSGHAQAIASERMILCANLDVYNRAENSSYLEELADAGVKFALCIDSENVHLLGDIEWYDLINFPFEALTNSRIQKMLANRKLGDKPRVMVNNIHTYEQASEAMEAKADLLQGFYYQYPKTYSVRPIPAYMINRFKIMQILESEKDDVDELARAISLDLSISLRLIKFVNSAAFSLVREIDSVRQAIALIGYKRLKNWLHLIIISDTVPSGKTMEIAYNSAVRGKFLELLALYSGQTELADKLYLLGLFSLLETILECRFKKIFRELNLNEEIESALLDKSSPLLPWLYFVRVLESGNWIKLNTYAEKLGVDLKTVSASKLESLEWANNYFNIVH